MVQRSDIGCCVNYTGRGEFKQIEEDDVPEWLGDALLFVNNDDEFYTRMVAGGAIRIESYGEALEGIDIWVSNPEDGKRQWLCQYWSDNEVLVNIVIDSMAKFLEFQAQWVAPMASKIIAADEQYHAQQARSAGFSDLPTADATLAGLPVADDVLAGLAGLAELSAANAMLGGLAGAKVLFGGGLPSGEAVLEN